MEIRDLYDENKRITGETIVKGETIPKGKYYITVVIWIQNEDGEFLIQKRTLRKFHTATSNCNEFNLPLIPFEADNNVRKSALHFDLTRNNIFKLADGKISIIDFDDAKYGESVCDVAILIANLFFSKTRGIDLEGMKEFINQYYMNDLELKKEEEHLIKKYALEWIKYILNGNEFDTSTTENKIQTNR